MATNQSTINSFLDQYRTGQNEPTPQENQPVQAENSVGSQFLQQYQPTQESPMTPEQAALMTHPTPSGPPERFNPELIGENIKKGFADFAAIPGYAVDLVNWPLHKLGITPDQPFGGSDMIRNGWELLTNYQYIKPQTESEKYQASVGQFLGSSIMPSGGLLGKVASRGVPLTLTGKAVKDARQFREVFNIGKGARKGYMPIMGEPATTKELMGVIGVEAASATTGGIGAQFGTEVGKRVDTPYGPMLGSLAGAWSAGMVPIYFKTAGATIWNGIRSANLIRKDSENIMSNIAKSKIINAIGENPQAPKNIEAAQRLQKEIPGFNPSAAAATGSEGLAKIQQGLDEQSVENYVNAVNKIRQSQEAIDNYYKSSFGTTGKKLTATKVYRGTVKNLKEAKANIQTQAEAVAAKYTRKPIEEIGQRLRQLRATKKSEVSQKVNQAYSDLYKSANDLGIVDDASDLYKLGTEFINQDAHVFQRMPGVYSQIREVLGRDIDPSIPIEDQKIMVDFPKLHSLYRQVSRQNGQALKSGDAQSQWYLGQIKDLLDTKLSQFDDPIYGTFAAHKRAVDEFYKNEYVNVFRKGVGGKMSYDTRWDQQTPDEKIISTLVMQQGTSRGIDQFNKLYADVPEAQTLLRNGILDMFASETIKKDVLNSSSINTFLNKYKQVFDKIPDMRNTFMNEDAVTSALVNRQAQIIHKTALLRQKDISPYAKIAGFNSPKDAVAAGLKDPKIMRVLTRNATTKSEKKELSGLIADVVLEQSDPWAYLLQNESQLAKHFNEIRPGHFQKLKNIAEAESILSRYQPKGYINKGKEGDLFRQKTGTSFSSALAQWRWALLYGKTSVWYPAADMGAKYLTKIKSDQIDALMERALYDPDLATTMSELTRVSPTQLGDLKVQQLINRLGLHAINNGIRLSLGAQERENKQQHM